MPRLPAQRTVTAAESTVNRALNAPASAPHRAGVFGGTFDPPHLGHVSVARDVADALQLDEVVWVPAFRSPLKPEAPETPPHVRLAMVGHAADADSRFRVDDCEILREGPSYTVDTLREMRAGALVSADEIVLIMGVDQYATIDRWREPDAIRQLATIAVMDRGGEAGPETPGVRRVPVARVDISATAVRQRAARGDSLDGWVLPAVADVIAREGLYGS